MALKKSIETEYGCSAGYHKVSYAQGALIEVKNYFSKEARDNNKQQFSIKRYNVPTSVFSEEVLKTAGKSNLTEAYAYLKTLPEFSGAEDI